VPATASIGPEETEVKCGGSKKKTASGGGGRVWRGGWAAGKGVLALRFLEGKLEKNGDVSNLEALDSRWESGTPLIFQYLIVFILTLTPSFILKNRTIFYDTRYLSHRVMSQRSITRIQPTE
jgi:hypothetical protein